MNLLFIELSFNIRFCFAGVQIAYFAIIGTQMSMILLSIVLIFGICRVSFLV